MSKESVIVIVNDTINTITVNLNRMQRPVDKAAIEAAFDAPIKAAFKQVQVNEDDKKLMYKQLSLAFHPDKLANGATKFHKAFNAVNAENNKFISIPQQTLQENKGNTAEQSQEEMDLEFADFIRINKIIIQSKVLKQVLKQMKVFEQMKVLKPLFNERMRYKEPFQTGLLILQMIVPVYSGYILFIASAGCYLVLDCPEYLTRLLLNVTTNNHYDDALNARVTKEIMAQEARLILRDHHVDTCEMMDEEAVTRYCTFTIVRSMRKQLDRLGIDVLDCSDAEIIELYSAIQKAHPERLPPALSPDDAEKGLRAQVKYRVGELEHLNLIIKAFHSALTQPFTDKWYENVASVCLRTFQVVLFIPLVVLHVGVRLMAHTFIALFLGLMAFLVLACITPVIVTNIPLYIYDLGPYIYAVVIAAANALSTYINGLGAAAPDADTNLTQGTRMLCNFSTDASEHEKQGSVLFPVDDLVNTLPYNCHPRVAVLLRQDEDGSPPAPRRHKDTYFLDEPLGLMALIVLTCIATVLVTNIPPRYIYDVLIAAASGLSKYINGLGAPAPAADTNLTQGMRNLCFFSKDPSEHAKQSSVLLPVDREANASMAFSRQNQ